MRIRDMLNRWRALPLMRAAYTCAGDLLVPEKLWVAVVSSMMRHDLNAAELPFGVILQEVLSQNYNSILGRQKLLCVDLLCYSGNR